MFKTGFEFYLQLPSSGDERLLHPAIVEESSSEQTQVLMTEENLELDLDLGIILYYELQHGFVQQPARIIVLERDDSTDVVTVVTTGDPISADTRECYRVTAISADADARVGSSEPCGLRDVSATGFAIVSSEVFSVGESLPVVLRFEDSEYTGTGCIQSTRELGRNRTRYGVLCSEDDSGGALLDGLNRISLLIQRSQLSRR